MYSIMILSGGASFWFEGMKAKRVWEGKEKITSLETLKRKLWKRYVPANYMIITYRKITDLKHGKLSVGEYIDELKIISLMLDIKEIEE